MKRDELASIAADRAELEKSRETLKGVQETVGESLRLAMRALVRAYESDDPAQIKVADERCERLGENLHRHVADEYAVMDRLHALRIEELTHASLATTQAMVTWTKVLAAATVVLAIATVALIWATVSA